MAKMAQLLVDEVDANSYMQIMANGTRTSYHDGSTRDDEDKLPA